jgi:hypothetical protein
LEKVQQLPVEVQVGIARRVESCIKIARAAMNEAAVVNIASSAMEEQAKAIGHGTMDLNGPHRQLPRHGAMPR